MNMMECFVVKEKANLLNIIGTLKYHKPGVILTSEKRCFISVVVKTLSGVALTLFWYGHIMNSGWCSIYHPG